MMKLHPVWILLCLYYFQCDWEVNSFHKGVKLFQKYLRKHSELILKGKLNVEDIEKYKRIQQLVKLKEQGVSYEQMKEIAINGTATTVGKKKTGRRNFEQRLRTIVGIKGETTSSKLSSSFPAVEDISKIQLTDDELEELMNDDSNDDEVVPYDEEEMLYEKIVLEIMEEESLKEIEENFSLQRVMETTRQKALNITLASESSTNKPLGNEIDSSSTPTSATAAAGQEELYTPRVSTWGIFPRPKNISQAYGGGRIINSKEMDYATFKSLTEESSTSQEYVPATNSRVQQETNYKTEIEAAFKKSRVYMFRGYPKLAIEELEGIRQFLIWETEFSGEVWLELAMAYETLYQLDEARSIYNKLLSVSWSQKVRRNASLLLSGLDIAKKVNKKLSEGQEDAVKAFNSFSDNDVFNEVMDKAVYSSWDNYKRGDRQSKKISASQYNLELDKTVAKRLANATYKTVEEAYLALLIEIQPLQEVKTDILVKAIRKLNTASSTEKYEFIGTKEYRFRDDDSFQLNTIISALKSANKRQSLLEQRAASKFNYQIQSAADIKPFLNGSWELVTSISLPQPYQLKKYDFGANRRFLNLETKECCEVFPSFFGLATSSPVYSFQFNEETEEIVFSGENLLKSSSPWQTKRKNHQTVKVVYCDDIMMLTKESSSSFPKTSELFTLWKRLKDNLYKKY